MKTPCLLLPATLLGLFFGPEVQAQVTGSTLQINDSVKFGLAPDVGSLEWRDNGILISKGTLGNGTLLPPDQGPGTRMLWYPGKAAFRVGACFGGGWDEASIGSVSVGMGYGALASGTESIALGRAAATGERSFSVGGGTTWHFRPILADTPQATDTVVTLPTSLFASLSSSDSRSCLLFCGVEEGKAELEVVLLNEQNHEIGTGGSVWIELLNIKKMYVRAKGTPLNGLATPFESISSQPNPTPTSFVADDNGHVLSKPHDEDNTVIVYVHGIHGPGESGETAYKSNISSAETVYKRLWHQGFKGRFAFYKWPALTPAPDLTGPDLTGFKFNESEYRAWKYGRGLAQFLGSFPAFYSRNLYSFSQGAVVCGAALTTYEASVLNYVISQGALPAGCYDPSESVNSYQDFIEEDEAKPTPDYSNDLGYRNYLSGLNVTGKVSSFFNIRDFALKTGDIHGWESNWEAIQLDYKPNAFSASSRTYAYDSGPPSNPFPIGQRCFLRKLNFALEERRLFDAHESMAFVARPRSEAVGARAQVGGKINTAPYDIGEGSPSNFGRSQEDHSGQFVRGIQQTQDYYLQLGVRLGVLNSPQ